MRIAGQTGLPTGRSGCARGTLAVRAGDEVEAALMTLRVHVLANQNEAWREGVTAAESHFELLALRYGCKRVGTLRLYPTQRDAKIDRTVLVSETRDDRILRRA